MDEVLLVVGAVAGIGLGAGILHGIGKRIARRPSWWFWATAVIVVCAGVAIAFVGLQAQRDEFFVAGVGAIAGGLTGLKYGAQRVPGIPQALD